MITRRKMLAAAPLVLASCRKSEDPYFGKTDPPQRQRLVAVLGVEPGSLDPHLSAELLEERVIYALFEGLTTLHPATGEAMAGLATHYRLGLDERQYTFYLRGHPQSQGIRLSSRDDLPGEFTRGVPGQPDVVPARWSDGVPISADDFVYSWRRTLDPATGGPFAYLMYCIENAEAINSGKMSSERLGVRAVDQYTFQVNLRFPVPYFLELAATKYLCPVPRHRIEPAGKAWTEARHIATTGPFTLRERRSGEKLVLARNPFYYEAAAIPLEEIEFLPMLATAASANLYRTAEAVITPVVPSLIPALRRKLDYRPNPLFGTEWANLRTTQAPFNDVRVRYALNMATDKRAIANLRPGQMPATTLVPPTKGYRPPAELRLQLGESETDVLACDPRRARELMESATGTSRLRIRYTLPPFPNMQLVAQILQQQWKEVLNVDLDLAQLEVATWVQATFDKNYPGIVASGDAGPYLDPSYFLQEFTIGGAGGSDWADPEFDSMLADAGGTTSPADRLRRLAQCESRLLASMPIIPLSTFVQPSLAKPFVKGLSANPLDREQFKYVWIDTNWRPAA